MKFERWSTKINEPTLNITDEFTTWHSLPKYLYNFTPFLYYNLNAGDLNLVTINHNIYHKTSYYTLLKKRIKKKPIPYLRPHNSKSEDIFMKYIKLRKLAFSSFFRDYRVDVPVCFLKSWSIKRSNFQFPLLKFSNYLMVEGKKLKSIIFLLKIYRYLWKLNKRNPNENVNWFTLYSIINLSFLKKNKLNNLSLKKNLNTPNDHFISRKKKYFSDQFYLYNFFINIINITIPLFTFSVYSVDKNIRKFAKSRSSKYVFVWKYIPKYKRNLHNLRLTSKDIKFNSGKSYFDKIITSLSTLKNTPEESFVWKANFFSQNYVYKNFRRSLLVNLKSTS